MKKICILFIMAVFSLNIIGCDNANNLRSDSTTFKTCTTKNELGLEQTFKYTAINDVINQVEVTRVYSNETLGVDSFDNLSYSQRENLKLNMLNNIGLEQTEYEGIKINIDINNQIIVTINVDLNKADKEIIDIVGLGFLIEEANLENIVSEMINNGALCKQ